MNYKLKRIDVKCGPCEEKDVVICLKPEEKRCCIHGIVKLPGGCPAEGAVVKLFKKKPGCDPCDLIPVTFTFTDKCGQFLFACECDIEYVVKVFYYVPECTMMDKKDNCDC